MAFDSIFPRKKIIDAIVFRKNLARIVFAQCPKTIVLDHFIFEEASEMVAFFICHDHILHIFLCLLYA